MTEYNKCKNDIQYFIETYCMVVSRQIGKNELQLIQLRDFQKEVLSKFKTNEFTTIHGDRQVGLTTITALYVLHFALFVCKPDDKIIINSSPRTDCLFRILRTTIDALPSYLKPQYTSNKQQGISFNGVDILSGGYHVNKQDVKLVWFDNYSQLNKNNELYVEYITDRTETYNGKIILTTTQ